MIQEILCIHDGYLYEVVHDINHSIIVTIEIMNPIHSLMLHTCHPIHVVSNLCGHSILLVDGHLLGYNKYDII